MRVNRLSVLLFLLSIWSLSYGQNNRSVQKQLEDLISSGRNEFEKGNSVVAFNHFITARKWSKQLNHDEQYVAASVELANYFMMRNDPDKARELFQHLALKSMYSPELKCRFYHRKAFIYNQVGLIDSAITFSKNAMLLAQKNNLTEANGTIYNELGNLYEKKRMYDSSLFFYDKALLGFAPISYNYANTSFNKARALYLNKDLDEARTLLESWTVQFKNKDWWNLKSPAHFYLAQVYFQQNDSFQGYKNLTLSHESEIYFMRDLHGKELRKLQVAYETEEKNAEILEQKALVKQTQVAKKNLISSVLFLSLLIVLLGIFFFVLRRKNKRLTKLNEENEFLLGEINHRTKNNLQLILSLISRELSKDDSNELGSLQNITTKIESISTLHQQLYINEEKSAVKANNYLSALVENLKPIYTEKNIDLQLAIDDEIELPISKAIYLGLLLNELIVNSIKHAFSDNQKQRQILIEIEFLKSGKIKFLYKDNGKGIPENKNPKLISLLCRQLKMDYQLTSDAGFSFQTLFHL